MQTSNRLQWLTIGLITGIFCYAWHLQATLFLNSDVSWLLHAANRLWHGGTYRQDFFELNPPLILYIYWPVIFIKSIAHTTFALALRGYVFMLTLVAILISHSMLKHILLRNSEAILHMVLLISMTVGLLILPLNEFGQREHCMLVLTMPYFLLCAARINGALNARWLPCCIGVCAGIGFAIKPYFLTSFILLELYLIYRKHSLFAWLRVETLAVGAVSVTYMLLVYLQHQDYLTFIVPLIASYYYQDYHSPLRIVLFNDQACYCYVAMLAYYLRPSHEPAPALSAVLLLGTIGFYLAYVMQQTYWYYHILPMLVFNVLLLTYVFTLYLLNWQRVNLWRIGILTAVLCAYLVYRVSYVWLAIINFPSVYFVLFAALSGLIFLVLYQKQPWFKPLMAWLMLLGMGVVFYNYTMLTTWQSHIFILTTSLLFLCFLYAMPSLVTKWRLGGLMVAGSIIFAYPCYQAGAIYMASLAYGAQYQTLINELQRYQNHSVYFFTDSDQFPFPAVDHIPMHFVSRFSCLTGLPKLKPDASWQRYQAAYQAEQARIDLFANAIAEDFARFQPDYVLVDVRAPNRKQHLGYFGDTQIDYLKLFMMNKQFHAAWQPYQYVRTIDGQPLYKFAIYQHG